MTSVSPTAIRSLVAELEAMTLYDVQGIASVLFGESRQKFSEYPPKEQANQISWLTKRWKETKDCTFIELALWAIPYTENPSAYGELISTIAEDCGETHLVSFLEDAISEWIKIAQPKIDKITQIFALYTPLAAPYLILKELKDPSKAVEIIKEMHPKVRLANLPSEYLKAFVACINSKSYPHTQRIAYFNSCTCLNSTPQELTIAARISLRVGSIALKRLVRVLHTYIPAEGEHLPLKIISRSIKKERFVRDDGAVILDELRKFPKLVAKLASDCKENPDHPASSFFEEKLLSKQ